MAAYIIVDVDVKDAKAFEAYKQPTAASIRNVSTRMKHFWKEFSVEPLA